MTERSNILLKIADRMEANLEMIAVAETWDNGKGIREPLAADIPLAIDHFRYFASAIRAQEGGLSQIDDDTVAYHFHEPLGVVGQIIPWNFPILMATWKLAPALAAGNCVVLKPAEQTPASILILAELVGDLLPAGVLNIVNGFGVEAGKPLASNKRIKKIAFTGETTTGRLIMQYASQNIIPVTLELGGKSPNIFFEDVLAADDSYRDKALEGFAMFALNQGEVCTCPSRALVQESIFDDFVALTLQRDHYLPLHVIRAYLDDIDAGREPDLPQSPPSIHPQSRSYSRSALLEASDASAQLLSDAFSLGLIQPAELYTSQHVALMRALVALEAHGIDPRHVRALRQSAERDVALIEASLSTSLRRPDTASRSHAHELAPKLAERLDEVRGIFVQQALGRLLSD